MTSEDLKFISPSGEALILVPKDDGQPYDARLDVKIVKPGHYRVARCNPVMEPEGSGVAV